MVAAGELDDAVPAREPAGHPDHAHRGLGARRHQPDLLAARDALADRLGQQDLTLRRSAEGGPPTCRLADGVHHGWVRVSEQ